MNQEKIGYYDIIENCDDELLYEYADYVYQKEDYSSVEDFLSNVISVEFFTNTKFNQALEDWYATQGKDIKEEVRGYMPYKQGFLMTHGCNYDWKSADLCGGTGDGRAWKDFEAWIDENSIDIE